MGCRISASDNGKKKLNGRQGEHRSRSIDLHITNSATTSICSGSAFRSCLQKSCACTINTKKVSCARPFNGVQSSWPENSARNRTQALTSITIFVKRAWNIYSKRGRCGPSNKVLAQRDGQMNLEVHTLSDRDRAYACKDRSFVLRSFGS